MADMPMFRASLHTTITSSASRAAQSQKLMTAELMPSPLRLPDDLDLRFSHTASNFLAAAPAARTWSHVNESASHCDTYRSARGERSMCWHK
jgi:hypothetical protein